MILVNFKTALITRDCIIITLVTLDLDLEFWTDLKFLYTGYRMTSESKIALDYSGMILD